MKIAITVDPEIPVPPLLYGGIERIVDLLIKEYLYLGHEVTLFANKNSKVQCVLIPYPAETSHGFFPIVKNTLHLTKHILTGNFDIIHSFSRLGYLTFLLPLSVPKVMSYQREPTLSQIKKAQQISKRNTFIVTGCSNYIANQFKHLVDTSIVYNGVSMNQYKFRQSVDLEAPLIFLGRIEKIKGTHIAIEVAQKANRQLLIAGNVPEGKQKYFDEHIKPHLNDQIKYVGPVDDFQKIELLGKAFAFLMPIQWNEPFGIVIAEAMACGTPVIGFNRGSVPELIEQGISGFKCENVDQMVQAVSEIPKIDRSLVRKHAEKKFCSKIIAANYLSLYENLIKS